MGEPGEVEIVSSDEYEKRYGADRDPSALSIDRISELFQEFLMAVARPKRTAPDGSRDLAKRLRDHLGSAPTDRPVVKAAYASFDLPNVHLALERWFAADGRSHELIGMRGAQHHGELTLGDIIEAADRYDRFVTGAVDYAHLPISPDEELACVSCGFYLGTEGEERFAVLLRGPQDEYGRNKGKGPTARQQARIALHMPPVTSSRSPTRSSRFNRSQRWSTRARQHRSR